MPPTSNWDTARWIAADKRHVWHPFTPMAEWCAPSLEIFVLEGVLTSLQLKIAQLRSELTRIRDLPAVAEVRQCVFVGAIELAQSAGTKPGKLGKSVCQAARRHALLLRPIRDCDRADAPYCINESQIAKVLHAIEASIHEVCGTLTAQPCLKPSV